MRIDVLTLFPEMFEPVIATSIIGRARSAGIVEINCHHIRNYSTDKHARTDLPIYGNGRGMLMTPEPIFNAYESVKMQSESKPYTIYMSPSGNVLNQTKAIDLSKKDHICIISGHYEGVDQRIIDEIVDEEISIGDYVLTGGEIPALVLIDAVVRLYPGVIQQESWEEESHSNNLLEHPHYTKPFEWHGMTVPEVLISGHHANIEQWRHEQSLLKTLKIRPDLLEKAELSEQDVNFLLTNGWNGKK